MKLPSLPSSSVSNFPINIRVPIFITSATTAIGFLTLMLSESPVLAEYQYDSRDDAALALGQNDLFVGGRLALNDADSSEVLFGISQDLDDQATRSVLLEAETRLGDSMKLNVEGLLFHSSADDNLSYQLRQDDYIQLSLYYYY